MSWAYNASLQQTLVELVYMTNNWNGWILHICIVQLKKWSIMNSLWIPYESEFEERSSKFNKTLTASLISMNFNNKPKANILILLLYVWYVIKLLL